MEWEFESKMDNCIGLFTNGLRNNGISCHRESCFTVMDFDKMKTFLNSERENYNHDQWQQLYNHFNGISYLSPMNRLTATQIKNIILTER
jgi:hypothetical protein